MSLLEYATVMIFGSIFRRDPCSFFLFHSFSIFIETTDVFQPCLNKQILFHRYYSRLATLTKITVIFVINQFVPNAPFLYPLKTSENRKGALGTTGLTQLGDPFSRTLAKTKLTFACSKSTIEILEKGVEYVQS